MTINNWATRVIMTMICLYVGRQKITTSIRGYLVCRSRFERLNYRMWRKNANYYIVIGADPGFVGHEAYIIFGALFKKTNKKLRM